MSVTDGQLLNVVDQQEDGNFHIPATLSRGDLIITVSTNGASPYPFQNNPQRDW